MTMFAGMKYTITEDVSVVDDMIASEDWVMQQKMDGTRALVRVTENSIDFYGSTGQPLSHTAAMQHFDTIRASLTPLMSQTRGGYVLLDGELMIRTGEYRVFDIVVELLAQRLRYSVLRSHIAPRFGPAVTLVEQWETPEAKRSILTQMMAKGVEGVVFKHRDGTYTTDGRSNDVVKYKFVKTADVVVLHSTRARNEAGREVGSFEFGVVAGPEVGWDGITVLNGVGYLPLGTCSAIGKPEVQIGDVIEVAYLYRDQTGGLIQPRMTRRRDDKPPWSCASDQFQTYSREAVSSPVV